MNLQALNVYGLSEVIGPGVAQEYGATKDGLTIWEDHFFPKLSIRKPAKCCPTVQRANWC
jgi:phenylacetate-coenzyme A ligase PaaK-like adenylate-forming protein